MRTYSVEFIAPSQIRRDVERLVAILVPNHCHFITPSVDHPILDDRVFKAALVWEIEPPMVYALELAINEALKTEFPAASHVRPIDITGVRIDDRDAVRQVMEDAGRTFLSKGIAP